MQPGYYKYITIFNSRGLLHLVERVARPFSDEHPAWVGTVWWEDGRGARPYRANVAAIDIAAVVGRLLPLTEDAYLLAVLADDWSLAWR